MKTFSGVESPNNKYTFTKREVDKDTNEERIYRAMDKTPVEVVRMVMEVVGVRKEDI